ncbi:hypothetical protein ACNZ70_000297, partial [Vibrio mimicus]
REKSTITPHIRISSLGFLSALSDFLFSLSILYSSIPVSTLLHFIPFPSLLKFNCLVVACVQRNTFSAVYLESSRFGGKS